jgi:hypothetical protein
MSRVKKESKISYETANTTFNEAITSLSGKKTFNLEIIKIPNSASLYQGTDFTFNNLETRKSETDLLKRNTIIFKNEHNYIQNINFTRSDINAYYQYYNKRNHGAYFLSSYEVANIYGLDKEYSSIVYASVIDYNKMKSPLNKINQIYPLYFIPKKCYTIKYLITKELNLLDIGNINTIQLIWILLHNKVLFNLNGTKLTDREISDYKYSLCNSCANDEGETDTDTQPPCCAKRVSDITDDRILVKLFKILHYYFFKKGITINGWIYNGKTFHEEICLIDNEHLKIEEIHSRNIVAPKGIPTYDRYMENIRSKIIPYNEKSKINNILHNYIIPNPDI